MATLAPGSKIGPFPYRILQPLGNASGMSDIYLATVGKVAQPRGQDVVVLKIARVDRRQGAFYHETLNNEVERLRRLKHPGIVRLYPIQKEGVRQLTYAAQAELPGQPWFSVMEYLAGGSLADLIRQQQALPVGLALEIARGIASTLDYIHSRGQVHLDVKAENILFRTPVRTSGNAQLAVDPVLIDFGVARDIGQTGLEAGTLQFAPPERIAAMLQSNELGGEGAALPHPSMDVYALGVLLYEMLTGRLPFTGRTKNALTTVILTAQPAAPSRYQPLVTEELDQLVVSALNKDPQARPTAESFAIQLEELSIRLGYRAQTKIMPKPPVRRKPWLVGATAAVLLLAVLLGSVAYTQITSSAAPEAATSTPMQTALAATTLAPSRAAAQPTLTSSVTATVRPSVTLHPSETATVTRATAPTRATPTEGFVTSTPLPVNTPAPP